MGMKAEQWRQIILSFESKKTYNNPFLDVSIWSVFTGPSGRRIRREAYWDGGNTYRIAFAPTETGMWSYRLEAPEETGLSGVQGTIECIPYEGNLAIYQHGFLKVHPSGRYLTYADGTPFFWLGDTHWEFAFGERWDESNHPQMTSMFRGMADRRKEQGYNVYQTNLRSDSWKEHKSRYWKTDATDDVPDVAFYQNELDRRMQYLADLGFINALGFAWKSGVAAEVLSHPAFSMGKALYESKIYLETPDLFAWTLLVVVYAVRRSGRLLPGKAAGNSHQRLARGRKVCGKNGRIWNTADRTLYE